MSSLCSNLESLLCDSSSKRSCFEAVLENEQSFIISLVSASAKSVPGELSELDLIVSVGSSRYQFRRAELQQGLKWKTDDHADIFVPSSASTELDQQVLVVELSVGPLLMKGELLLKLVSRDLLTYDIELHDPTHTIAPLNVSLFLSRLGERTTVLSRVCDWYSTELLRSRQHVQCLQQKLDDVVMDDLAAAYVQAQPTTDLPSDDDNAEIGTTVPKDQIVKEGEFVIRVVAAEGLSPFPSTVYASVSFEDTTASSPVSSHSLSPIWNWQHSFVCPSSASSLRPCRVAVLEYGSDKVLGETRFLPADFAFTVAHQSVRQWVSLSASKDNNAGHEPFERGDSRRASARVLLQFCWRRLRLAEEDKNPRRRISCVVSRLGVSLVDSNEPSELLYASMHRLVLSTDSSVRFEQCCYSLWFTLASVQIDDPRPNSSNACFLTSFWSRTDVPRSAVTLSIRLRRSRDRRLYVVSYASLLIQELQIDIDSDFLQRVIVYIRAVSRVTVVDDPLHDSLLAPPRFQSKPKHQRTASFKLSSPPTPSFLTATGTRIRSSVFLNRSISSGLRGLQLQHSDSLLLEQKSRIEISLLQRERLRAPQRSSSQLVFILELYLSPLKVYLSIDSHERVSSELTLPFSTSGFVCLNKLAQKTLRYLQPHAHICFRILRLAFLSDCMILHNALILRRLTAEPCSLLERVRLHYVRRAMNDLMRMSLSETALQHSVDLFDSRVSFSCFYEPASGVVLSPACLRHQGSSSGTITSLFSFQFNSIRLKDLCARLIRGRYCLRATFIFCTFRTE